MVRSLVDGARTETLPIIVLAPGAGDDAAAALRAGAADYLRMPLGMDEIVARVVAHVERGRLIRQARQAATTRAVVLDIVRDVTATLSTEEIFDILVRRVSRLFRIDRCSMILVDERGHRGTIVAAQDDPDIGGMTIDLHRYPEIRQAIESESPVLVRDFQESSLFEEVRPLWETEGIDLQIRSVGAVPFSFETGRRGVFFLRSGPGEPILDEDSVQLASAIVQGAARALNRAAMFKSVLSHREQLEALAKTDELTGCLSRRYLMERLEHELERAARYQRLIAIAMLDIDNFKRLNDTLGHTRGDAALRTIGGVLRRSLRGADFVGRYGGDEFLIVLPETGAAGALELAERIREGIGRRTFDFRGRKMRLTVSGGVASYPEAGILTAEELIDLADQALYRAKWEGRNKIVCYSAQLEERFPS
jgi:two-component system cell cycle response regulator